MTQAKADVPVLKAATKYANLSFDVVEESTEWLNVRSDFIEGAHWTYELAKRLTEGKPELEKFVALLREKMVGKDA